MEYFLFYSVSADLEEAYFTLGEIKENLEDQRLGWKSKFKGGLEKIEVEHIEQNLESRAAKEEVRYDFTFYTPTCRYVRVKVSFFISSYLFPEEKNFSECMRAEIGLSHKTICTLGAGPAPFTKVDNTNNAPSPKNNRGVD